MSVAQELPFTYVEFDSSDALSDLLGAQKYRALLMAPADPDKPCGFFQITSDDKARELGTAIATMYSTYKKRGLSVPVYGLSVARKRVEAKAKSEAKKARSEDDSYSETPEGKANPASWNKSVAQDILKSELNETDFDLNEAFKKIDEQQFHIIGLGFQNDEVLSAIGNELDRRADEKRKLDGLAIAAISKSIASIGIPRDKIDKKYVCVVTAGDGDALAITGAIVSAVAVSAQEDPARPFQTLELDLENDKDKPRQKPSQMEMRTIRNQALIDGISTLNIDSAGTVRIERLVTTAKESTYHNPNVLLILSFIRWDFERYFTQKYPRYKLAGDNFKGSGAVMTPRLGKAECICLFRQWEELGYCQDVQAFSKGLDVKIDPNNNTVLRITMTPKLISQLCVIAATVKFKV